MNSGLGVRELVEFESEVAARFNRGEIKAPVHLYSGNELQMLEVFEGVESSDWVCCSWRSHYQALLKGVPREVLMSRILAGGSIALCFPDVRMVSSAIVGGVIPIAVGLAMGMKRRGEASRVHCFVGDMTAETGIYHEAVKYASQNMLNMRFVIEDNGISVCTPTKDVWGQTKPALMDGAVEVCRYSYESRYPHAGSGTRINF